MVIGSKIRAVTHEKRVCGHADADEQRSVVQEKVLLVGKSVILPAMMVQILECAFQEPGL